MLKLIVTVAGFRYCEDCYRDVKSEDDSDFSMFKSGEETAGTCQCCGLDIIAPLCDAPLVN